VFHLESAVQHPARTPVFNDAVYWNCILEETDSPSRNLYEPQLTIVATGIVKRVLTQFIARHGDFPASEAPRDLARISCPGRSTWFSLTVTRKPCRWKISNFTGTRTGPEENLPHPAVTPALGAWGRVLFV
jgi:hypothetical protein